MSVHTCPKSRPLSSRLLEFHLPKFDFDEFREIIMMVANRCRLTREVADKITSVEWYEMGTKDVRNALRLAKLVTSVMM